MCPEYASVWIEQDTLRSWEGSVEGALKDDGSIFWNY